MRATNTLHPPIYPRQGRCHFLLTLTRRRVRRVLVLLASLIGLSVLAPAPSALAAPDTYMACGNGTILINNPSVAAHQSMVGYPESYVWLIYGLYRWDPATGWQFEEWGPWKYSRISANDFLIGSIWGYGGPSYTDYTTGLGGTQSFFAPGRSGYYAVITYTYADGQYDSAWATDVTTATFYCRA